MAIKGGDRQQLNYYFHRAISKENIRGREKVWALANFFPIVEIKQGFKVQKLLYQLRCRNEMKLVNL